MPGRKHGGADATSRHPVGEGEHCEIATMTLAELVAGENLADDDHEPERMSKNFLRWATRAG